MLIFVSVHIVQQCEHNLNIAKAADVTTGESVRIRKHECAHAHTYKRTWRQGDGGDFCNTPP